MSRPMPLHELIHVSAFIEVREMLVIRFVFWIKPFPSVRYLMKNGSVGVNVVHHDLDVSNLLKHVLIEKVIRSLCALRLVHHGNAFGFVLSPVCSIRFSSNLFGGKTTRQIVALDDVECVPVFTKHFGWV